MRYTERSGGGFGLQPYRRWVAWPRYHTPTSYQTLIVSEENILIRIVSPSNIRRGKRKKNARLLENISRYLLWKFRGNKMLSVLLSTCLMLTVTFRAERRALWDTLRVWRRSQTQEFLGIWNINLIFNMIYRTNVFFQCVSNIWKELKKKSFANIYTSANWCYLQSAPQDLVAMATCNYFALFRQEDSTNLWSVIISISNGRNVNLNAQWPH